MDKSLNVRMNRFTLTETLLSTSFSSWAFRFANLESHLQALAVQSAGASAVRHACGWAQCCVVNH